MENLEVKTRDNIVFTSEPMRIGKTDWRFIIRYNETYKDHTPYYTTGFQWYEPACHCLDAEWRSERAWPRYDINDGMHGGLPKTLKKLWEREEKARVNFGLVSGNASAAQTQLAI